MASDGWRIGSICGVPMFLSRGWPVGAGLIVLIYYSALEYAGVPAGRALLMGVMLAAALFLSVLVHELAHGLTGTALGRRPSSYTLTLWGGYTRFSREHASPRDSALIAAAGPAANLVLALVFWSLMQLDAISPYVMPLAYLNLALGLFNLAPGIPMDGGKVVEAGVWAGTGSRERGTLAASWSGLVVAVALGLWAIVRLVQEQQTGSYLWLLLIAGFLANGAVTSLRHSRARLATSDLDLRDLMTRVPIVTPTASVEVIPREGALVVDGGSVRGVVTPEARASVTDTAATAEAILQVLPQEAVLRAATGAPSLAAAALGSRTSDLLVLLTPDGAWTCRVSDLSQKLDVAAKKRGQRR